MIEELRRMAIETGLIPITHKKISVNPYPEELKNSIQTTMVFNYDPILGLQYFVEPPRVLVYDIDFLPSVSKEDLDRLMHHIKRDKIMFINSKERNPNDCGFIFSNF